MAESSPNSRMTARVIPSLCCSKSAEFRTETHRHRPPGWEPAPVRLFISKQVYQQMEHPAGGFAAIIENILSHHGPVRNIV